MLTAVYIGIVGIGFVLLMMNMYHPYTKDSRFYAYTTPIVPQVKGKVLEVPVRENQSLKKVDILFKIDPQPYEFALQQSKSELAAAERGIELREGRTGARQTVVGAEGRPRKRRRSLAGASGKGRRQYRGRQCQDSRRRIQSGGNSRAGHRPTAT